MLSFTESFAPTAHYNLPRCRVFLAGLFVVKANAMPWLYDYSKYVLIIIGGNNYVTLFKFSL